MESLIILNPLCFMFGAKKDGHGLTEAHTAPHPLPKSRREERTGREYFKLMGLDNGSLKGKAKAVCGSRENKKTDSPLPMGNFSAVSRNRVPSLLTITWEDKCHNAKCFPSSSFFSPT